MSETSPSRVGNRRGLRAVGAAALSAAALLGITAQGARSEQASSQNVATNTAEDSHQITAEMLLSMTQESFVELERRVVEMYMHHVSGVTVQDFKYNNHPSQLYIVRDQIAPGELYNYLLVNVIPGQKVAAGVLLAMGTTSKVFSKQAKFHAESLILRNTDSKTPIYAYSFMPSSDPSEIQVSPLSSLSNVNKVADQAAINLAMASALLTDAASRPSPTVA